MGNAITIITVIVGIFTIVGVAHQILLHHISPTADPKKFWGIIGGGVACILGVALILSLVLSRSDTQPPPNHPTTTSFTSTGTLPEGITSTATLPSSSPQSGVIAEHLVIPCVSFCAKLRIELTTIKINSKQNDTELS